MVLQEPLLVVFAKEFLPAALGLLHPNATVKRIQDTLVGPGFLRLLRPATTTVLPRVTEVLHVKCGPAYADLAVKWTGVEVRNTTDYPQMEVVSICC